MYKNFKRLGFRREDKSKVEKFRNECKEAIENAKSSYFQQLGNRLADSKTSQKCYWKIVNKLLNKTKAPKIPPLLIENKFVVECKAKAAAFNKYFASQCKPLVNGSVLPALNILTPARLNSIEITNEDITCILKSLNQGKASGPDEISVLL